MSVPAGGAGVVVSVLEIAAGAGVAAGGVAMELISRFTAERRFFYFGGLQLR